MKRIGMALICLFVITSAAFGTGTLVPTDEVNGTEKTQNQKPFDVGEVDVDVTINNGIAITTVEQTFLNHEDRQREGIYFFPLPKNASISNFAMKIKGNWVTGEVLEKKQARDIYDSIVNKKKDPGLLEQEDYKKFSVRVFPIPANGTQRIRIQYYQPLRKDTNYRVYTYPLERKFNDEPYRAGELSVTVEVLSEAPLKKVYSPSHGDRMTALKNQKQYVRASIEESGVHLDHDFVIGYQLEKNQTRMGLVATREKGKDGYFMGVVTPGMDLQKERESGVYTFLLDASGSMDGGKLQLAKKALRQFLGHLQEQDRINIMRFNDSNKFLARSHLKATEENVDNAKAFLESIDARGDTDLKSALADTIDTYSGDRKHNIVIFSDGIAHDETYLKMATDASTSVRVFSLGIGNEVSRPLLKSLADQTGGHADFVSASGDLNRRVRQLYTKSSQPVMKDISFNVEGGEVRDVHPSNLDQLFAGQQLLLFGRFRGSGKGKATLTGTVNGETKKITRTFTFPEKADKHKHIERLWAMAKIRDLLQKVRSGGERPSLREQIVDLGTTYSVVTPYTSFLVLRNEEAYEERDIERKNLNRIREERQSRRSTRKQMQKNRSQTDRQEDPFMADDDGGRRGGGSSFGGGAGGPIGPFFLLLLAVPALRRLWNWVRSDG